MKDKKLFITSIIFFVIYLLFIIAVFSPLKNVFMPFVTALALVYFLHPAIVWLKRFKINPVVSTAAIYVLLIAVIAFAVVFAIPTIYEAVQKIWQLFSKYFGEVNFTITDVVSAGAEKAYSTAVGVVRVLTMVFVGAVAAFYILAGKDEIKVGINELIPLELKSSFKVLIDDVKASLDSFFKGQLLIASILFVIDTVFLYMMGIPYAVGLGAIAAILDIIPYAGAFIGIGIILAVTLVSDGGKLIVVFVGLMIIQQIENNIISPKISSDTLSLHPSVTILVLYLGSFGGFWGILLCVPLTSIFWKICRRIIQSIM